MLKTRRDIMKQFSPERSYNSKVMLRNDQNGDNLAENFTLAGKEEIAKLKARNNSGVSDYTLKMS